MAAPRMVKEGNTYKLVMQVNPTFEVATPMTKQEMLTLALALKDSLEELKHIDIPGESEVVK